MGFSVAEFVEDPWVILNLWIDGDVGRQIFIIESAEDHTFFIKKQMTVLDHHGMSL